MQQELYKLFSTNVVIPVSYLNHIRSETVPMESTVQLIALPCHIFKPLLDYKVPEVIITSCKF